MEPESGQAASTAALSLENAHAIRITSHGKMSSWVEFALDFFEKNRDQSLVLHTLPHSNPTQGLATETGTEDKRERLHPSTSLIPRLISVAEIIKREYVKKLDPVLAEKGCLSGLHQYNEVGTLEQLNDEEANTEEERLRTLSYALQGRNHLKLKRTAYMKITLSRKQLSLTSANYQQPTVRKLSKSARARVKNRLRKEQQVN